MFLIIITCIFIYKGLKFFVKLRHYFKDILNNYYNTIFTREKINNLNIIIFIYLLKLYYIK